MVKALAPRYQRGSMWVWLSIVIAGLVCSPVLAQRGDAGKGANTPKAPAESKKEQGPEPSKDTAAADDDKDTGPKNDSGELFKDPRAEKALQNTFPSLVYPNPRPSQTELTQVRNMATGLIPTDRALLARFIDFQAAELTNHANIRALIDPPANQRPGAAEARAIERATDALLGLLTTARSQQTPNQSFLSIYQPLLQQKLTPLLDNHLLARIQAMIVLASSAYPNSIDLFLKELGNPNQVIWVKLWAARGIANITQHGRVALEAQKSSSTAALLLKNLDDPALPWPVAIRYLEALGANRMGSTSIVDRTGDVLGGVVKVLSETDARPDVRAASAWAAGQLQLSQQISQINYPLVTYLIGQLTAEIGDKIGSEYDHYEAKFEKNKGVASYLTGLIITQIEPAFSGVENVRNSGLLANGHPSAVSNKPFAQGMETQIRSVGKAAVELIRAGGVAQAGARKELASKVRDLRAFLDKNKPKSLELVPGGAKFSISPGQVAGAQPAK